MPQPSPEAVRALATAAMPSQSNMQAPIKFQGTDNYIATQDLMLAVNAAVTLKRPLLVKGEPGTGKTLLAEAIASALSLPLLTWHVKSTTRAQDGLYVYDTVQRLYDSRFGDHNVQDIADYIHLGPMGQAFSAEQRVVLLIDEIDKADLEFPNDLLHELDRMRFAISETGETIAAAHRPVVIITSNAEKELPDAFLRRCVFHFIDFPDAALMARIVEVHHPGLDDTLLAQALEAFYAVRGMERVRKKPSTSELIDWIAMLRLAQPDAVALDESTPFLGTLLKKEQDLAAFNDQITGRFRRRF